MTEEFKKISLILASRRPSGFKNLVDQLEEKLPEFMLEYIAFNNDPNLKSEFEAIKAQNPKIKVLNAGEDFIFRMGFDTVYNTLMKAAKGEYCLILFDCDEIEVDKEKFLQFFSIQADVYFFKMFMQRGQVEEKKFQLFKKDILKWVGAVHENQAYSRNPNILELEGFRVNHNNAQDDSSKVLAKDPEGFIILEKTEEGTDSDKRNLLYEGLAYRIIHENLPHFNKNWFIEHYKRNKAVIDWYYERANQLWGRK